MKIDILTLFPDMFRGPFDESIIKRAQEKNLVEIKIHNLRDWAVDERGTVDDRPFGGGPGMIIKPQPVFDAVEALKPKSKKQKAKIILMTPQGKPFSQQKAKELSKLNCLILICGHYEGVDERVSEHLVDEEISIGDYVLTGGELPAMVVTDALVRLIPGVLEKPEAVELESFGTSSPHHLEPPQYTRPEVFRGWQVPEILLSGNHQEIEKWRREQSLKRTQQKRPDLLTPDFHSDRITSE